MNRVDERGQQSFPLVPATARDRWRDAIAKWQVWRSPASAGRARTPDCRAVDRTPDSSELTIGRHAALRRVCALPDRLPRTLALRRTAFSISSGAERRDLLLARVAHVC